MLLLNRTYHPIPFVLLLAGLSASPLIAANLYLPSFPAMMMAFHASIGDLQLSASLFIAFFALSQFLSGVLADRFGRRRIVLLGLSIYVLGSFIILVPHTLNILYLGRCLQGLGAGAGTALSRVMLRDRFTGQKLTKMFTFIAAMIVLARYCTLFRWHHRIRSRLLWQSRCAANTGGEFIVNDWVITARNNDQSAAHTRMARHKQCIDSYPMHPSIFILYPDE